jgi:WD40-like Beta Propeller Repeat
MTGDPKRTVDDGELDRRLRLTFRTIMPLLDANPPTETTAETEDTPLVMIDLLARRLPKRSRFTVVAVAAAAVIVAGTVAIFAFNDRGDRHVTTASGPVPGDTGIVYTRFIDAKFWGARLVIADSDGRNAKELTDTSSGSVDRLARISPDGKLIVFYRDHGTATIHMVGSDGQNEHQVDLGCVDPCIEDKYPSFTPGGQHIAFQRIIGPRDPDTGSPSRRCCGKRTWTAATSGDCPNQASTAPTATTVPATPRTATSCSPAPARSTTTRAPCSA